MQVMNLPNAYGVANPTEWIIEKRPEVTWMSQFAPGGSMAPPRLSGPGSPAWGASNPTQWIVEKRPEVTWIPWFAPGGSMGRAFLPQVALRPQA